MYSSSPPWGKPCQCWLQPSAPEQAGLSVSPMLWLIICHQTRPAQALLFFILEAHFFFFPLEAFQKLVDVLLTPSEHVNVCFLVLHTPRKMSQFRTTSGGMVQLTGVSRIGSTTTKCSSSKVSVCGDEPLSAVGWAQLEAP